MKISKLQIIVIAAIILALIIAIIMMSSWQSPRPKITVHREEAQSAEEQKTPQAGRFELPEEEYVREEVITKEELVPEKVITGLDMQRQSMAITETAPTNKAQEADKLSKKYPAPKKLREIKDRGLIVY